jgi:hypothetical protein
MSGEYIPSENPSGILPDAFLQKGRYTVNELFEEVAKLLAASPIRSEREKSDICPTLRAERPCGISDNHLPQVPAPQQAGSDEFERRNSSSDLPVMQDASEV